MILGLPKVLLQAKQLLPEYSGIYYVLDEDNQVWYIGKAKNIRKRWQGKAHHRIYQLKAQKKNFTIYYESVSEYQLDFVEKERIEKYQPHLNSSPVKTKKIRPTETLLRETIAALADFSFILGVDTEENQILICLDLDAFRDKFKPDSEPEEKAILKALFIPSRKTYARKWKGLILNFGCFFSILVNGYTIHVNYWSSYHPKRKIKLEYIQAEIAQEYIRALNSKSLTQFLRQNKQETYLQNFIPYASDLVKSFFHEPIDREAIKNKLIKLSEDYKAGRRGVGSRSQIIQHKPINSEFSNIDELLIYRRIDVNKNRKFREKFTRKCIRIELYIQHFSVDSKTPQKYIKSDPKNQFPVYNLAYGILNNQKINTASCEFDTIYIGATVDKKAWLLVEDYLKDFAKPATKLSNGEAYIRGKFYVSPRKYIVPAKVNIKLESIGYSAWIPFGISKEFNTFESAKQEIRRRLENSGLPGLKIVFKSERIEK